MCTESEPESSVIQHKFQQALDEIADYVDEDTLNAENSIPNFLEQKAPSSASTSSSTTFKVPKAKKPSSHSTFLSFPFSTFRVPREKDAFLEFISRWRKCNRYAFSLAWIPKKSFKTGEKNTKKPSTAKDGAGEEENEKPLIAPPTAQISGEDSLFFAESQQSIALTICWDNTRCYVVNLTNSSGKNASDDKFHKERMRHIKEVLELPHTEKILFDSKPQLKLLMELNIFVISGVRDPRIGAWILEPDTHKDVLISTLMEEYTEYTPAMRAAFGVSKFVSSLSETENAIRASLLLIHQSFLVMSPIEQELKVNSQYDLFCDMEMKLVPILAKMEYYGVGFSTESLLKAREQIEAKIRNLEARARKICKLNEIDLNSPSEVSYLLFDHLKLPYPSLDTESTSKEDDNTSSMTDGVKKLEKSKSLGLSRNDAAAAPTRTKRVEKSTRAEILQAMARRPNANPLPSLILEFRTLSHTINNYMDPLPTFAFHSKRLNMTRIYSTCHQTCVPTGRLAFDHPNLQSIRHAFEFIPMQTHSPHGSKSASTSQSPVSNHSPLGSPIEINIRDSFIASPSMTLVSFDYCQLELRIMTHYADDPILLEQLRNPNIDLFNVFAGQWLDKHPLAVNAEERAQAKHICYGLLYGMGNATLSRTMKVSIFEAKKFRTAFQERFSGLNAFLKNTISAAKICGYSETIAGRRRHFPDIFSNSKDRASRADYARAVRQIHNTVCQGSAADIVKLATIRIEELLRKEAKKSRCIINLHDELVYELPTDMLDKLVPAMQSIMENVVTLRLPLPVRVFYGPTWGHLAPWIPPQNEQ